MYRRYIDTDVKKARHCRERGVSLKKISQLLDIPKGTIGNWVRDIQLSEEQLRKIKEVGYNTWYQNIITIRKKAKTRHIAWYEEGKKLGISGKDFLGLGVYASEGTHTVKNKSIQVANSDPALLISFMELMKSTFNISQKNWIVRIYIHEYHNEKEIVNYWEKNLNISKDQIRIYKKKNGGKRKRMNYMGCARIELHSIKIRCMLEGLIDKHTGRKYPIGTGLM